MTTRRDAALEEAFRILDEMAKLTRGQSTRMMCAAERMRVALAEPDERWIKIDWDDPPKGEVLLWYRPLSRSGPWRVVGLADGGIGRLAEYYTPIPKDPE